MMLAASRTRGSQCGQDEDQCRTDRIWDRLDREYREG